MKITEQHSPHSPVDGIWEALRPSPVTSAQPSPAAMIDIRRLMLQSQEFRSIMPFENTNAAAKGNSKDIDRTTVDAIFACLAICADEERRAMTFGSREGATAMRRSMHAIKEKFGII